MLSGTFQAASTGKCGAEEPCVMPCPFALNGLHLCEAAIHKHFRSRDVAILHAALDETFFCACLRLGNKWTCACCCFSPADAATFASSPSTGTAVKVWNFRVNKLSNSARWSLCACARHCWIAA